MAEPKIVGIHGGKTISGVSAKPLPKLVIVVRDNFRLKVQDLLRHLFDGADDALFEMADKAGTNGDQALYFDAMRELRLQKRHIANAVVKQLLTNFNSLTSGPQVSGPSGDSIDSLDLIDKDELEVNVAVDAMVSRLNQGIGTVLEELSARISFILDESEVFSKDFPASPHKLCDAFAKACDCLDFGIRAKLIVLKLFERYVLSKMAAVYKDCNQQLRQSGVLPALTIGIGKTARTNSSKAVEMLNNVSKTDTIKSNGQLENATPDINGFDSSSVPTLGENQYLSQGTAFGELRSLLHSGQPASSIDAGVGGMSNIIPQTNIIQQLSAQQNRFSGQISGDQLGGYQRVDFRSLLSSSSESSEGGAISSVDSDVISLVSMLFDFILDDRQLQPVMKALIARLQIPILKVAMLDRSFFDRGGHPARKLLNEIAAAALGWTETSGSKSDRLKGKIEAVVDKVLNDFDDNLDIFQSLLDDFIKFIVIEDKRGQLVEQRTKDAEKGKAANDLAKKAVDNALNAILADQQARARNVPECAEAFLSKAWSRVLNYTYLNGGVDSESWKAEIALVKDLIWTVSPDKEELDVRGKLLKTIPRVMRKCREGLNRIMYDQFEAKTLLADIEAQHVNVLNNLQTYEEFAKSAMDDNAIAELVQDTLEIEQDFNDFKQSSVEAEKPVKPAPKAASRETNSDSKPVSPSEQGTGDNAETESSVEPTRAETVLEEDLSASASDSILDAFSKQVERASIGTWFEVSKEGRPERCKLAAHIKAIDKFVFVNRSGIKVMEQDKSGFASLLRNGELQVLNDGLLFDRALESVIGSLRGAN
ncbi:MULTISPECIES: DUF1631 domain-containing protein [unclassified Oleiphilus]|nr:MULTISPECIES: DUF1631 domain-containing protein [unclassified Oleiphilus]KZY31214.1 hypothetical protein A3729_09410 [Oleiphilus sp. HI0043]KZZ68539.1 hypothetical protein A3763_14095 [Oleiphilus sp. HI0128]